MSRRPRLPLVLLAGLWLSALLPGTLQAQLQVDLEIKRNLFIRYEPILATVSITNFSGQTVFLEDSNGLPWFGFNIQMKDGRPIPPRSPDYGKDPVVLEAGTTLRRQVNLTPLYGLDDYGTYNIQATVRDGTGRYYSSRPQRIEMTEGRVVWQQVVGHPDDGTTRQLFLLTHRLPASTALYLRIMDSERGKVFATHRLGTFLTYDEPQVLLDRNNQVHVLHLRAPKSYIYSHIGLNGEILDRKAFTQAKTKPLLERTPEGRVMVVGGAIFDPTVAESEPTPPALSERPVPLPGSPGAARSVPSPTPQKKGGLNLWPFQKRESAKPEPTPRS